MTNYKKSLLSVAAAFALATTAATAGYIPLTSTTVDNKWVLFGASGFITTGVTTSTPKVFSIESSLATAIKDYDANKLLAVSGLTVDAGDLGSLKSLTSTNIEVRVDTTDLIFSQYDPVRTIYVGTTAGEALFAFEYKSILEGKNLEFTVNDGTAYEITIDDVNTFDNPGTGTVITGISTGTGITLSDLTGDNNALDYDFADNPVVFTEYDATAHRTAIGDSRARLYSYDAESETWGTYDTANTVGTNNFNELVKGKGYWGKLDTNTSSTTSAAEAGVVLQSASLTAADYLTAGLSEGWNLLAFDDSNTEIKKASTGMILTVSFTADDNITIIDSSGNHEIDMTFVAADMATIPAVAKHINSVIDEKKLKGDLPYTFDLKAFPADTSGAKLALISNKRFTVKEKDGAPITAASTLAGKGLWDIANDADAAIGADLTTTGLRSKYGEYSMIVDPLTGGETASTLASKATVNVNVYNTATSGAYHATDTRVAIEGTNTDARDKFDAVTGITATEINLDINGTMGQVLLASAEPFYVRDNTFSRVFRYAQPATPTVGTLKISSYGTTVTPIGDQTITAEALATNAASAINTANTASELIGAGSPSGEASTIVFVVDHDKASEFFIAETVGDHLTYGTTSSEMAQGAISGVYSIGALAKKGLKHTVDINITEVPDDLNNTVRFDYVTLLDANTSGTAFVANPAENWNSAESSATDNEALLDRYVSKINLDLSANNMTSRASHNYTATGSPAADLNASLITISGSDVIDVYTVITQDVNSTETFTVTFNTPAIDTNNTMVFDNTYIDFNATGNDYNSTVKFHSYFKLIYDLNTTSNWEVNSTDSNATLDFYARNQAAVTGTVATGSFVYTDTDSDDTTVPVAAISDYVEGNTLSAAEAAISDTQDGGYLENTTADLTTDLRYNTTYTPNYVMDGPLFVMREAGYKLESLVTGTMDLSDGIVDWDSIDLTRPPSQWLESQDYNLFDTDDRAGYWAKLEYVGVSVDDPSYVSPITIGTATLSKNYTHHFDTTATSDATTAVDKTYNYYSGNLNVTITGIDYNIDNGASARITASINGKKTELTRDGSTTTYTGKISYHETDGISIDTAHEITIDVSDGLGNKLSKTLDITTFDNVKPTAPTVTVNGLGIDINSTGAAGYYVFDNTIPETGTAAAALASSASASITNVCKDLAAVDASSSVGYVKVIAVDGTGVLGQGNASDPASVAVMPILKDRVYVSDAHSAGLPVATSGGAVYDASCETTSSLTVNTGVTISTITEGKITKLAYTSLGEDDTQNAPIVLYVTDAKTPATITAITYPDAYVGKDVFIDIDGQAYGYTLPTRIIAETKSSADAADVSGNILTSISF